jgi:hypothetical protein
LAVIEALQLVVDLTPAPAASGKVDLDELL